MKIISDTLEPVIETWSDPGDYPSGAGGGPLPSHHYVDTVEGEVVVEIEPDDLREFFEPDLPHGITVTAWEIFKVEGNRITFIVKKFDAETVERDYQED